MLVFKRREGQTIRIGDDIIITVVTAGPMSLRIGVDAPAGTRVDRGEVRSRIENGIPAPRRPADG